MSNTSDPSDNTAAKNTANAANPNSAAMPANQPITAQNSDSLAPGGFAVVEGVHLREAPIPCCGIGIGWFLFILGFFLGCISWYVGSFILLFVRVDSREKPGYIACLIASIFATIVITLALTKGAYIYD